MNIDFSPFTGVTLNQFDKQHRPFFWPCQPKKWSLQYFPENLLPVQLFDFQRKVRPYMLTPKSRPQKNANMSIGKRIKMVRGALSRPEFGQKIGVSQSAVQNYETLNHIPKGDVLQRIHNEYGVDLNWLLTGEGESYNKGKQEGLPSADGKGLWGQTRHHVVDGKQIDVTLFTPPSTQPSHDPGTLNPFVRGVGALQTIFDSGDPLLISTIQANLTAFEQAALKDQFLHEQSLRIQKLEEECKAFKEEISNLKKLIEADDTGSGIAKTGADIKNQET